MKIKIVKDGPYLVTGGVPLTEKIIVPDGNAYKYEEGRELPQAEEYALCRCGKSKNPPFCDGAHLEEHFDGTETASRDKYEERAEIYKGPTIDMMDDRRCALARFCHQRDGDAWQLVHYSSSGKHREQAIQAASECPSGRLTVMDKFGNLMEPELSPAIIVSQDPERRASGGLFIQGGIPLEAADGELYEVQNRMALCRCGASKNKPFCDACHIRTGFDDGHLPTL